MRLEGKVAIITGSGRGIGRTAAILFAKEGASVVINDIDEEPVKEVVETIKGSGGNAVGNTDNIVSSEGAKNLVEAAISNFGKLDILVNNAGITRDSMVHKMTEEQWDQVMAVNLKGIFNCVQAIAPHFRDKEATYNRKVISLSSSTGVGGNVGQFNYAASKAGVIGLTKTLAKEWGRYKVNVNAVAPGYTQTRMIESIPEDIMQTMLKSVPIGRAGSPEDVANLILFLASNESDYISGQTININGGMIMP